MKIATHHTEGEGVAAGQDVEERLLLDGVALHPGDVAVGDPESAGLVEADLADAAEALADEAAVPAGQAADGVSLGAAEFGRPLRGEAVEQLGQRLVGDARFHGFLLSLLARRETGASWSADPFSALWPAAKSASLARAGESGSVASADRRAGPSFSGSMSGNDDVGYKKWKVSARGRPGRQERSSP
jgi:hypothetical protein